MARCCLQNSGDSGTDSDMVKLIHCIAADNETDSDDIVMLVHRTADNGTGSDNMVMLIQWRTADRGTDTLIVMI